MTNEDHTPKKPAIAVAYNPVHRGFVASDPELKHASTPSHRGYAPFERWMREQPGESPYHAMESVAVKAPTTVVAGSQAGSASDNGATAGSLAKEK
ncbi:hypothetical protein DL770_009296 [Monosporascus sp. CRB-9-2]|nr:hypothetical protein DL770_009296 [Monosporascus sp. CRB-9-2]